MTQRHASLAEHIGQPDNLTLIRLLAAVGVVFGHSFALAMRGHSEQIEPVSQVLPGTYSGSIAVDAFFLISGFLITHSLLRRPQIGAFLRARAMRVLPAFFTVLLVTVLVFGPLASTLVWGDFLLHPQTRTYLASHACLNLCGFMTWSWSLPETFSAHANPALNGSLWSLFLEIKLYLLSAFGVLIYAYRKPRLGALLSCLAMAAIIYLGALRSAEKFALTAVFMYGLGAFARFYADQLKVYFWPVVLSAILVYLLRLTPFAHVAYAALIATSVCYLAYAAQVPRIKLPGDYSYGLFLWSFPIQQMLAAFQPELGPYAMFAASLALSLLFAVPSWHFIEQPALRWKRARAEPVPEPRQSQSTAA